MYKLHIDYGDCSIANGQYGHLDEAMTVAEMDARKLGFEIFWFREFDSNENEKYYAGGYGISYTITIDGEK